MKSHKFCVLGLKHKNLVHNEEANSVIEAKIEAKKNKRNRVKEWISCDSFAYVNNGDTDEEHGRVEMAVKLGLYPYMKILGINMEKEEFLKGAIVDTTNFKTSHKKLELETTPFDCEEVHHEYWMI